MNKYTKKSLQKLVKKSNSFTDVVRHSGIKTNSGGSLAHIKKLILNFNISTKHFYSKEWKSKVCAHKFSLQKFKKEVLCKQSIKTYKWKNYAIRKRIIEEKLLPYICSICGLKPKWNKQKLTLEMDHINGDKFDNRLKNLRFLCPNCHSQTETYSKNTNGG